MIRTYLTLLGSLNLSVDDQPFAFAATPIAMLLGYLALHAPQGRAVSRATLAGKLWPNLSEKRARYTLNDTLYRLRRTLGDTSWLCTDSSTIRLVNVSVDVELFKAAVASCRLDDWQLALDLYHGDLLEDLDADWLLVPRVSLHDLFLHTLARVCTALADSGRIDEALAHARRWALADPFNEDAHRMVMKLSARRGQHIAALQQYDHLVRLLDEEFQTAPLPETRAFANAIRAEYDAISAVLPHGAPLVGRRRERAILLRYAEQAHQGTGHLILVEGECGIGKTRLVAELAAGAAWRGMHVASSCARPGLALSPYAPLDEAIGAALSGAHVDQIHSRLAPGATALLHDLVEGPLGATAPTSAKSAPEPEDVWEAFDDLLQALSDAHPCLLILDDMQWAGARVWLALQACALRFHMRRVLVVLCYRGAELRANPAAWRALRSLDLELAPPRLSLQELAPEESTELVRFSDAALDDDAVMRLHQRAGGNPLFLREMLVDSTMCVPETLRDLLDERLSRLTPAARAALGIGAVLGYEFSRQRWRDQVGPELDAAATELVNQQILDTSDRGYRFRQDILREYLCTQPQLACRELALGALSFSPLTDRNSRRELAAGPGRMASAQETGGHACPPRLSVHLARADAPLGRTLCADELISVRWTVDAGEPDAAVLRRAGKVSLRRHRILRLIDEARAQGGAPTDLDLACALGVTERTIVADMAALRLAGQALPTRRRAPNRARIS